MQILNNLVTVLPLISAASALPSLFQGPDDTLEFGLATRDIEALLNIRDAIDDYTSILIPRTRDANGNPVIPYDSTKQPHTVANKLKPGGMPDKLDPLPAGESQYRGDADRFKKANPKPYPDAIADHAIVSSSKQGKDASKAGTNPLGYAPRPEQQKEAGDVSGAMQAGRKEGKPVIPLIDGQPPSRARSGSTASIGSPAKAAKKRAGTYKRSLDALTSRQVFARALDMLAQDVEMDLYARDAEAFGEWDF